MNMSIFQTLLLASLPMTLLSSKVVTGFDCEITGSNEKDWGATVYGKNGGKNGGWGDEGRLFEFDCQTDYCYDTEEEQGDYWVTCGYSWKDSFDLDDSDDVIVEVRTEVSSGTGSCRSGYTRVLNIDSTGWDAKDTSGNRGDHGFHFCYKTKSWLDVKTDQDEVVTDMYAGSKGVSNKGKFIGHWDTHDDGYAMGYGDGRRTGGELFLYAKKGRPEFPVKMVGYWTRHMHSYQRMAKDISIPVEKIIQTSSASMLDTEEQKAWHRKITKSHDTAVVGGIKGPSKFMKLSRGAQYIYQSSEEHSESFNSRVWDVAMSTFKQTTTVNYDIDIPAYVPGEGTHMSVWFFKTTVIGQDLTSADQDLFDKRFTITKTGPCYDIPPNCLPGQCREGDPDCFTCQPGAEPIDSDFKPPAYCSPCPRGFEHTFFESFAGECQQTVYNSGEYASFKDTVETVESCAKRCLEDTDCYAFDFANDDCYLNSRCDHQEDDSCLSCKKTDGCPEGFELTFTGKPDGECQQSTENEGEYGKQTGQTMKQCAQRCYQDAECFAFDFKDGSCYLNKRCDSQDEGDGYTSCKKQGTENEVSIGGLLQCPAQDVWHHGWRKTSNEGCQEWWNNNSWGAGRSCSKCENDPEMARNCPRTCCENCRPRSCECESGTTCRYMSHIDQNYCYLEGGMMGAYCADSKKAKFHSSKYWSTRPCKQCPEGFELTFGYDGECQQWPTTNEGEYGYETGLIIGQCGQKCYQDADCVAFDFKDGSCYLNTRCDYQDEGDGYFSCKKIGTVVGARTTGIRSEAESMVAGIRSENDRLKHVNEVLKKTLEAMAN